MTYPNIILLTIDSLRSDKVYGALKKSKIPNFDKIINEGLFFSTTISSIDATDPSLGCIFTGKYPFKHKITLFQNHEKASFLFDYLNKLGYTRCSLLPNKTFFKTLSKDFESAQFYDIDPYTLLYQGTGKRILKQLESNSVTEPWIYYVHLMDLHPSGHQFYYPKEFALEKFGNTDYEKALSALDFWIGKIIQKIDNSKTLFILTSDHGDFIPQNNKRIDDIYSIQKTLRPLKKILPFDDTFWESGMKTAKFFAKKIRTKKLNKVSNQEKRTYLKRAEGNLFDETLKVPLIFFGHNILDKSIIHSQVSHTDILPTILHLLNQPNYSNLDGVSLLPLDKNNLKNRTIYYESASTSPDKLGHSIGIRTQKYKYFRSREKKSLYLYDIELDPYEENNISNSTEIVTKMEENLLEILGLENYKENLKNIIKKKRSSLKLK